MANWKHLLFLVAHTDSITWEAIAIIGIPSTFVDVILFYVAFLKLRFYFRTRSALDGLSGLAVLSMASACLVTGIGFPLQVLFPKITVALQGDFVGINGFGGTILFIVLRPYTRFGKPKPVVQEGDPEIKTMS